jgi:hypothetical protein
MDTSVSYCPQRLCFQLKMEAVCFCETLVPTGECTRQLLDIISNLRFNSWSHLNQLQYRINLKVMMVLVMLMSCL